MTQVHSDRHGIVPNERTHPAALEEALTCRPPTGCGKSQTDDVTKTMICNLNLDIQMPICYLRLSEAMGAGFQCSRWDALTQITYASLKVKVSQICQIDNTIAIPLHRGAAYMFLSAAELILFLKICTPLFDLTTLEAPQICGRTHSLTIKTFRAHVS